MASGKILIRTFIEPDLTIEKDGNTISIDDDVITAGDIVRVNYTINASLLFEKLREIFNKHRETIDGVEKGKLPIDTTYVENMQAFVVDEEPELSGLLDFDTSMYAARVTLNINGDDLRDNVDVLRNEKQTGYFDLEFNDPGEYVISINSLMNNITVLRLTVIPSKPEKPSKGVSPKKVYGMPYSESTGKSSNYEKYLDGGIALLGVVSQVLNILSEKQTMDTKQISSQAKKIKDRGLF